MPKKLSRRERQLMDIVYQLGEPTAAQIRAAMEDPPSYSAVRALLRLLVEKGHLTHRQDGPRYLFSPTEPREVAADGALTRVVETFFEGSVEQTVAALLDRPSRSLSQEELDRLGEMIQRAKEEGR
jgi:predicted transcriptional regulator